MWKTLLVIAIVALPASISAAEPSGGLKPDKPTSSDRMLPVKGANTANSCAAFGPGFVKIDGTGTCVKIGGAVSIGVGTSGSR
jgi:hypothetical protein